MVFSYSMLIRVRVGSCAWAQMHGRERAFFKIRKEVEREKTACFFVKNTCNSVYFFAFLEYNSKRIYIR